MLEKAESKINRYKNLRTVYVELKTVGQLEVGGDDGLAVCAIVVGFLYLGTRTPVRPVDHPIADNRRVIDKLVKSRFVSTIQQPTLNSKAKTSIQVDLHA